MPNAWVGKSLANIWIRFQGAKLIGHNFKRP